MSGAQIAKPEGLTAILTHPCVNQSTPKIGI